MLDNRVFIEPARTHNRPLRNGDGYHARASLTAELRRVVPDIPEPLHDDALAVEASGEAEGLHVVCLRAHLAERVDEASTRRLLPAANAALYDGFARDARSGIHLSRSKSAVGVGDHRHLALAGARTDQIRFTSSCTAA
jgi:hypothetical protein